MHFRFPLRRLWFIANLAGMAFYLVLASKLWVSPGEEGLPGGPGDAFYWAFFLVPILGVFLVGDFSALIVILYQRRGAFLRSGLRDWLIVAGLWVTVVAYDHHRAFRHIAPEFNQMPSARSYDSTRKQPNQASQPTSAVVTPPAGQEARQP